MSDTLQIFPNLSLIAEPFDGILLDAYGVFWGGNGVGLLPGSKEAMSELVTKGKIVGILSNTTQLAVKEMNKLHEHGLKQGVHFHFLMTSGEIAKSVFQQKSLPFATPNNKFWVWGETHPRFVSHPPIFQETIYQETPHLHDADFIYVSIPHKQGMDQTDPEVFRLEIQRIRQSGLPMVCPNPDRFAQEGNPPQAVVRQGSIAAIYKELGGEVFYIGKPYSEAYAAAMREFSPYHIHQPHQVLMVGDTPETDIRGARQFGMSAALVTQTGLLAHRMTQQQLKSALEQLPLQDRPHFFIQRLAS